MKNVYTLVFYAILTALVSIGATTQVRATHAMGADICYTWVSGNTYDITMRIYRDCAGVAAPATSKGKC